MFRFFESLPEELVLKIFSMTELKDQANIAQISKTFNRIVNDDNLKLEENRIRFLAKRYEKLPDHNHQTAVQIRAIFKKAFKLSGSEMEQFIKQFPTTNEFSGFMEGFLKGSGIGFGKSLHSYLINNSRPSLES